jgi:hypothetical protein
MPGPSNWVGTKQGRLYVIRRVGSRKDGQSTWECLCECGSRCVKSNGNLRSGVKSCGPACGTAVSNRRRVKHGYAKTKENRAWQAAKQRCTNPNNPGYKNYGARGITMHPQWVESFAAFLEHIGPAPGNGRGVSVDRINNDGNYEPGNVRWSTSTAQQLNNRRGSIVVDLGHEKLTLREAADRYGLPYTTLTSRWRTGLRGKDLVAPKKT